MAHSIEAHGLKRRRPGISEDGLATKTPVTCYLTRGSYDNEWYVWNTSAVALALQRGDSLNTCLVACNFEHATVHPARVLEGFVVGGMGSSTCVLEREICFREPIGDLQSVATQVDLVDVCRSKGIKCAIFLEHYTQNPRDEELQLGSRVCSAFVHTVGEMLRRKYDIAHHYPLFYRALGLYYSDALSSEPPAAKDIVTEGLLDRSVEDHQSIHGIPLVGVDHILFSKWNYPDDREERDRRDRDAREERSSTRHEDKRDTRDAVEDAAERQNEGDRSNVEPCPRKETSETFTANTLQAFNNLAGTLTDGPRAFPYVFTVHVKDNLTFDDLLKYCQKRACGPVGTLPPRDEWGSINPVLLMEDPVDSTGRISRRYAVTSRGYLSTVLATRDGGPCPCYNEVFLPGRPVSRLNLDVDLKCCRKCNNKFALRAASSTKRKVSEALTTSLMLVIVESLIRFAKVKRAELESDPSLRELAKVVGKIAVYSRDSSAKSKLSLRMLWYLPVELCSFNGIQGYKPLLDEMENVSLNYFLLSYPADLESCGLCELADAMRTGGCNSSGSRYLRLNSGSVANRRSSIDKAPYSLRKCVRLPNCYKEDSAFEYVETFNSQDIEDPGFDDPRSLSVGLSSNPILTDVTSLGSRFRDLLRAPGNSKPSAISGLEGVPDRARVESEARRLALLWGVPVTIRKTGSGLFCVQANEKSTIYPCPIHSRVHSESRLGAVIFTTQTKPKCFVP